MTTRAAAQSASVTVISVLTYGLQAQQLERVRDGAGKVGCDVPGDRGAHRVFEDGADDPRGPACPSRPVAARRAAPAGPGRSRPLGRLEPLRRRVGDGRHRRRGRRRPRLGLRHGRGTRGRGHECAARSRQRNRPRAQARLPGTTALPRVSPRVSSGPREASTAAGSPRPAAWPISSTSTCAFRALRLQAPPRGDVPRRHRQPQGRGRARAPPARRRRARRPRTVGGRAAPPSRWDWPQWA